jgi:hypothetical protein
VDKKTFFQLGITTISQFLQQKKINNQEGISDQKGWKSLPEVEKFQLLDNLYLVSVVLCFGDHVNQSEQLPQI